MKLRAAASAIMNRRLASEPGREIPYSESQHHPLFAERVQPHVRRYDAATATPVHGSLRICHLAYTFYENDNRVTRYAETMAQQGADVDVIALRRPTQENAGLVRGVNVFRIQQRTKTEKRQIVYLAKIVWFLIQSAIVL